MENKSSDGIINLLKGANIKEVERQTGIPADRMYKWIKGKGTPKVGDLLTLFGYFNAALDFEATGDGTNSDSDQPTETQKHSQPRLEAKPISLADPEGEHRTGDKIYELPDGQKIMEVKIVPAKGQAGYLRGFPDPEYYEDLPTLTIQVNSNHRGTYLAFEVKGDSMTPSRMEDMPDAILEGWYVVGREVPRHHWSYKLHTHSHSYWIIVHRTDGILIKQITEHNVDEGTITIHSLNPAYEDEELNLADIEQIFSGIKRIVNDR